MRTFLLFFITLNLFAADPVVLRLTGKDDTNSEINHILTVIKQKTGVVLSVNELVLVEDRLLAGSHFTMYVERNQGLPMKGRTIRLWSSPATGELIQLEAQVEALPAVNPFAREAAIPQLSREKTMALVRETLNNMAEDKQIRSFDYKDEWADGKLVRTIVVKGKRGKTTVTINLNSQKVVDSKFAEFPQADLPEFSLAAKVYPIYEEAEETTDGNKALLPRIDSQLRYLNSKVTRVDADPYASLKTVRYVDEMQDPFLGITLDGQKKGYWSMPFIKLSARSILQSLPLSDNTFANGVLLSGRYATVSIDPAASTAYKGINFTLKPSAQFYELWKDMADKPDHQEMIPTNALLGRPIASADDAANRVARRLPDHDPATYINDGFDEVQVYWSITQLFDSLHQMGFTDPELSTRPFNGFLFNPDISMRDNAFYTDDTINFTTYSAKNQNYARDNSTIWHELGHGVMDRLMGDFLAFNDTGGLQEGMADFVAQLVINDVTGGLSFPGKEKLRIFNQTGFYLTNEVHDDGEAYGGSMNDLLRSAMAKYGRRGLEMVTDLTLQAMRLSRNHPNLTAQDWFNHMLFADELGSDRRAPGELNDLIHQALNGRNFVFDSTPAAQFSLKNGNDEVTSSSPGSRNNPIKVKLKDSETTSYTLNVNLKSTAHYQFKYPVTIKVELKNGPLQGAIHWEGEEKNPLLFTLASEKDTVQIPVKAYGKCDEINRPDNSCVDFAYVQIWNDGETQKPQAKKRFYLRIYPQQ